MKPLSKQNAWRTAKQTSRFQGDETADSFAARLRHLREEYGLSLRALGKEIGVTANAVLRWEKSEVTPTRAKMIELANYFDVEAGWLAWGLGMKSPRAALADVKSKLDLLVPEQLALISGLVDTLVGDVEITEIDH